MHVTPPTKWTWNLRSKCWFPWKESRNLLLLPTVTPLFKQKQNIRHIISWKKSPIHLNNVKHPVVFPFSPPKNGWQESRSLISWGPHQRHSDSNRRNHRGTIHSCSFHTTSDLWKENFFCHKKTQGFGGFVFDKIWQKQSWRKIILVIVVIYTYIYIIYIYALYVYINDWIEN